VERAARAWVEKHAHHGRPGRIVPDWAICDRMDGRIGRIVRLVAALSTLCTGCGARSSLLVPGDGGEAPDSPLEGGSECTTPPYCDPSDLGHVYRCGGVVATCGSLEQCEQRQGEAECVNPCLDSLGNDTSNGCEFYAVEMDTVPEEMGVCYAVFIVNEWKTGEPAKIAVSRAGQPLPVEQFARIPVGKGTGITYGPYDPTFGLPAAEVVILFLSRDPSAAQDPDPSAPRVLSDCPAGVTPAFVGDAALHGTGRADAFRVQTNVPVVAYQMLPYGGGRARVTGSTLLLPTSAWDSNYLVADAYRAPLLSPPVARAGPTTVIIASEDATIVTIKPTVDVLAGGGLEGTAAGASAAYELNKGQYIQFTQPNELTGTAVQSSKPVAVIGASTLLDVPLGTVRADSAQQMLPPVRALGNEYVAVRYRSRAPGGIEESVPWRLVGAVDGTRLTYEPVTPAGAPAAVGAGELAEFNAPGPFVVRSQDASHPFYLASYMTGGQPYRGQGDPEFVNVVPAAQYLPRYTFFTDPTYPETNLVVVRVRDPATGLMPDVTLDCAGVLGNWLRVSRSTTYEFTRVDLSTGDFQSVNNCDNGVHVISAAFAQLPGAGPPPVPRFGVTIWGWGNDITWPTDDTVEDEANPKFTRWVSYGYPAGANFAPLSDAVLSAH
jgi:IgGFc binding protein